MKLIVRVLLIAALTATTGCFFTSNSIRPIDYDKRLLVAVGDMQNQTGNEEYNNSMDGLTGSLVDALLATECFRLIERQRLRSILEEKKLGMTGLLEPANAREVGQLLGVNAILFIDLASVKYTNNVDNALIAKTETEKFVITMNARLVAVDSGEILAAATTKSAYTKRIGTAFGFITSGTKSDKKVVVQNSVEESLHDLAQELGRKISHRKL